MTRPVLSHNWQEVHLILLAHTSHDLARCPDLHVNIEHILAENNFVLVFLNFVGTHKGEFNGRPPTNKPVTIRSADLYRIENDKIVEHWDVVDQLDLLKQTGAISSKDTSMKE
ncbi:MAG: ester cyclase [Nitrososphaeraceae archaeon]